MTACRPQPNFCVKEIYSFETLVSNSLAVIQAWEMFSLPNYFVGVSGFME